MQHDAARGHDAVVLAGRHRIRAVLPRLGPSVRDADAARSGSARSSPPTASGASIYWPLYLVLLFAVELHGGIGLYRLRREVGLVRRRRSERDAAAPEDRSSGRSPCSSSCSGFATLAAYIKIGIEHAPNYGERYVPACGAASRAARRSAR